MAESSHTHLPTTLSLALGRRHSPSNLPFHGDRMMSDVYPSNSSPGEHLAAIKRRGIRNKNDGERTGRGRCPSHRRGGKPAGREPAGVDFGDWEDGMHRISRGMSVRGLPIEKPIIRFEWALLASAIDRPTDVGAYGRETALPSSRRVDDGSCPHIVPSTCYGLPGACGGKPCGLHSS